MKMIDLFKNLLSSKKEEPERIKVQEGVRLCDTDLENCLLQQTTSYYRGNDILVATSKENELFLINYYDNTFYIVKVAYNNELKVVYDYRRKCFELDGFEYRMKENSTTAMLKLLNSQVEFIVEPYVDYQGEGCTIVRDQSTIYDEFVGYLDTYRKNINETAMMRRKETGYLELLQAVKTINDDDREQIWNMLDEGKKLEAIKLILNSTGLGLADCKKIADNPNLYL